VSVFSGEVHSTNNPFLNSDEEMEFIKRIVDAQPAELTAPAEPLEVVTEPDADHLRQLEKDKAYMQQWQAGPSPAYERPKQTHDCSLPAPTEPINEKLRASGRLFISLWDSFRILNRNQRLLWSGP
jgi:hypothetical protein